MSGAAHAGRSPVAFFLLVFALAIPIWLASPYVGVIRALKVPVTDLLLGFTPLAAAVILIWRAEGLRGVAALFRSAFDVRALARSGWLIPTLLLAPAVYLATYVVLHLAGHLGEPHPPLLALPLLACVMLVLALGEEGGWMGYAIDPMQARLGALGASLVLAVPWWLGHLPSILEIGGGPVDIIAWIPGAIALRILITWLYNRSGGCLFAAVLFHAVLNVGRLVAYPTVGAHYQFAYQALGYGLFLGVAVVVTIAWGAKWLARDPAPRR